jgi:phosphoribosylformylglycinamidine synthase
MEGSDAAVIRIKGTKKGIALKTDCNSRYVYLNPYVGGALAVYEAARNVACTGARPVAVTNCLNFGNPYDPEVFFQFTEAVRGMGDACRALETPVTGGNVSFYNQSPGGAIFPTPTIGMLGIIEDIENVVTSDFKHDGDVILLVIPNSKSHGLGGSEYLFQRTGKIVGDAPDDSADQLKSEQVEIVNFLVEAANRRLLKSAHDVSEGGVAIALTECCFGRSSENPLGATVNLDQLNRTNDTILFGEHQGQILLSADRKNVEALIKLSDPYNFILTEVGVVGGSKLNINNWISCEVSELREIYENALPAILEEATAEVETA